MLFFMAGLLVLSAPLVGLIWKQQAHEESHDPEGEVPRNLRESARLVSQSPHLRAIAALILPLGSVVTTVAGWQYKSIAKEAFRRSSSTCSGRRPTLVLLEVELRSEDEAVELPGWAAGARDVSEDPSYTNAALARQLGAKADR